HLTLLLAALALAPAPGGAGADVAALTHAARAARLADDIGWKKLLHFHAHLLGDESDADGPGFFLARDGKKDPAAELEATLEALFAPVGEGGAAKHAQCVFPARLLFLADRLAIDRGGLPPVRCEAYEAFRERMDARAITAVFSSYYLNNPASAFGHTFLRIDRADGARAGRHLELVDYGVDFAATVDTGNVLLYAAKGLAGMFHGDWSYRPYFYKVRQYADYESRDLWEYDLDLTPREVETFVAHLWELGSTWFDYYYLTENCSYGVLTALEAAAPRLDLLRHLGPIVIPADTVKAFHAQPGLVRAVHFRPSIRTQFEARAAQLDAAERRALEALIESPAAHLDPLPPASQAHALDAALDYVDLSNAHELLDGAVTPAADVKQRLMERRSALLVQSDELAVAAPEAAGPQLGHDSLRTSLGAGASTRKGPLTTVDVRLGLHDLADPAAGYPSMSRIDFLSVRLRYEPRANALGVEEATFADVMSLADFGTFERHLSWKARLGATTVRDGGCKDCLAGLVSAGGGLAQVLLGGRLTAYATTDAELLGTPALVGTGGTGLRLGVGPAGGLRLRAGDRVTLLGEAAWRWLPAADPGSTYDLRLEARFHLARWTAFAAASRWPAESQVVVGASLFL
ncbi:MAG: DUF4105 domain-containing protein, partial [Anaeromyxobacteraceae bacterium]